MVDQPLDTISFDIDADLDPIRARYRELDATTDAAIARNKAKFEGFFSTTASGHARLADMQRALGASMPTDRGAYFTQLFRDIDGLGKNATKSVEKVGEGVKLTSREVLTLGRVLTGGDMARAPLHLGVIAAHMFGLSTGTLLTVGGIIGLGAAFVASAYQAESALGRIQKALVSTGFAAGVTRDDIVGMAAVLDRTSDFSKRGAGDSLAILAGRGNIGGSNLAGAARASLGYSNATGLSQDQASTEIEKILAEPAKGAAQLDQAFKLLTSSELIHVRNLDAQGRTEEAQQILIDALNRRFADLDDQGDVLGSTFESVGKSLSDAWSWLGTQGNLALGGGTLQQRIDLIKKGAWNKDHGGDNNPDLFRLQAQQSDEEYDAMLKGAKQGIEKQTKSANDLADKYDGVGTATRDLRNESQKLADAITMARSHGDYANANRWQAILSGINVAATHQLQPGALDVMGYQNDIRVSHAPLRDRDFLRSQLSASLQYRRNLGNPKLAGMAGDIYGSALGAAKAQQTGARQDNLQNVQDTAAAYEKLAQAYKDSVASGQKMEATNAAHAAFLKGSIDNEQAYADALMRESTAKRNIASSAKDRGLEGELQLRERSLQLFGQSEEVQDREITLLRTRNDLIEEGYEVGSQAFNDELTKRQQINEELAQTDRALRKAQGSQDFFVGEVRDAGNMVGGWLDKATTGALKFKDILSDVTGYIAKMIIKLVIMNQIENAITQGMTGKAGTLPTMGLSDIFSSALSVIGLKTGAGWSNGVRYAAEGMVLSGPTAFHTPSGPVIGGELGKDSEALMPLARGPRGLGVRVVGNHGGGHQTVVHQHISITPDIPSLTRAEIIRQLPMIKNAAISGVKQAQIRGVSLNG